MRPRIFLAVGVLGLLVAVVLGALLTVRRVPRLTQLKPQAGVVVVSGGRPTIRVNSRAGTSTLDLGWCTDSAGRLTATQPVTAWTDTDALGRSRVWRIEQDLRPVCRFAESSAAVAAANRPLRIVALSSAAIGLAGFAALLFDTWRRLQRG